LTLVVTVDRSAGPLPLDRPTQVASASGFRGVLHESNMAFIKTIPVRDANSELREIYGIIRSEMVGSVPFPVEWTAWNIMEVFSLRPQFLWAFTRGFRHFMWDGELSRLAKEAIGVSVAQTNACHY
jgi:hypothetical protein